MRAHPALCRPSRACGAEGEGIGATRFPDEKGGVQLTQDEAVERYRPVLEFLAAQGD